MMATKLKRLCKYTLITYLSIYSFSNTYIISEEDIFPSEEKLIDAKKSSLNENYFNQIPKNDYIIVSGDTLRISISREYPELFSVTTVDGEGTIYLPRVNRIFVKGLSIKELNSLLTISFKEFVKYPAVEVEIESYRPIKVLVNGEVDNPGVKTLEGAMTVNNLFPIKGPNNLNLDNILSNQSGANQDKLKSLLQLTQGSNANIPGPLMDDSDSNPSNKRSSINLSKFSLLFI